jgi:hypothetical protein
MTKLTPHEKKIAAIAATLKLSAEERAELAKKQEAEKVARLVRKWTKSS